MSFHMEFHARPEQVERTMRLHSCPVMVHDFILAAMRGLSEHPVPGDREVVIEVRASGHLCEGENSYEVSTADIQVKRILIPLQVG